LKMGELKGGLSDVFLLRLVFASLSHVLTLSDICLDMVWIRFRRSGASTTMPCVSEVTLSLKTKKHTGDVGSDVKIGVVGLLQAPARQDRPV
jgi:hypothetical protein